MSNNDETMVTLVKDEYDTDSKDESFEGETPITECTILSNGETNLNDDQNDSTEADRNHLNKKKRTIKIIRQTTKLNKKMKASCCSFVTDVAEVDVRGKWVNVSD